MTGIALVSIYSYFPTYFPCYRVIRRKVERECSFSTQEVACKYMQGGPFDIMVYHFLGKKSGPENQEKFIAPESKKKYSCPKI